MSARMRWLAGSALAAVTAGVMLSGFAAPASANFLATGQDQAGDAADGNPARDIVAVGLSYDRRTGHLKGGVRLAGEPDGDSAANLTIFAGRRTAAGCTAYPAIGFATQTDLRGASWVRLNGTGPSQVLSGGATKTYDGVAEEYETTQKALAGARPNCVIAQLNDPGDDGVVYDVAGPFPLRPLPELEATLAKLPPRMAPNRTRTIRVTLRNPGDATTGRIRLGVAGARGLTVKAPKSLPALRPGAKRVVPLRVTLSAGARTSTALKVTAIAARGPRALDQGNLYLKRPPRAGGGGGAAPGPQLCFRYTWLPPYSELRPC